MTRYATNSWQARRALAFREPYTTGGAMQAVAGHLSSGRLNAEWSARYYADLDRIVYSVYSYATPIAWVLDDGTVVKVGQKFSITTSGHQGMLYALDASRETRADIDERADLERQRNQDRAAERREERHPLALMGHPMLSSEETSMLPAITPRRVAPVRMEYSETYSLAEGWAAPKEWGGESPGRLGYDG